MIDNDMKTSEALIDPLDEMLGSSTRLQQVKALIQQVAGSDINVLITGESGTGKELVARAIHYHSKRRNGPLVSPNCGAIPEGIFESEIFGHEKGSFTSAGQRRQGYFEMADQGTLLLDEIGEMPLQVQVKMLRVLESGSFLRVGGSHEVNVDVRVIAATNKDLGLEVGQGRFRQDLYYRLKAVNINVPPLRERLEDIPMLIDHFTYLFAQKNNRTIPVIESEAFEILNRQYWAGNIRELKNFIESMVALGHRNTITGEDVRIRLSNEMSSANLPVIVTKPTAELDRELVYHTLLELKHEMTNVKMLLQQLLRDKPIEMNYPFSSAEEVEAYSLDELEKEQIKRALMDFGGNRKQAADALGIGERTLYRKIKQYNLK
ncbi:MAG: sigma-54 dependent transcriptional regulator [Candidatus Hatepunaea meridiana]|nr:sigma-54 dependent transcriptional regulator [Candidatus Hatepunaea meridiana]